MVPTITDIKTAIRAIILSGDSIAVVFPEFIKDVIVGDNANDLKPTTGADAGKVHGWMIGEPAETNERVTPVSVFDSDVNGVTGWKLKTILTFPIWFLHYYQHGDPAAGTSSSKKFNAIREVVVTKFTRKPRLGITGDTCSGGNNIVKHNEMQLADRPTIIDMGEDGCHFAFYELSIELFRTPGDAT